MITVMKEFILTCGWPSSGAILAVVLSPIIASIATWATFSKRGWGWLRALVALAIAVGSIYILSIHYSATKELMLEATWETEQHRMPIFRGDDDGSCDYQVLSVPYVDKVQVSKPVLVERLPRGCDYPSYLKR